VSSVSLSVCMKNSFWVDEFVNHFKLKCIYSVDTINCHFMMVFHMDVKLGLSYQRKNMD